MSDNKIEKLVKENERLKAELISTSILSTQLNAGVELESDEIDLWGLWLAIWKGKWLIITATFVFSIVSVFYALSIPNEFKSTAILAPASQSGGSGFSELSGRLGGLASLAGLNLGGGGDNKPIVAMEVLKTWGFLEAFIEHNGIEVEVYAVKGWNESTNELIVDEKLYDVVNKKWLSKSDLGRGDNGKPSSWKLYEKIKNRISIQQDKKSGLFTLSVEYYSPGIAKDWVERLIKAINSHIQAQDKEEATRSIEYLSQKINETNIAEMQNVFYQLIEEQTKTLMLTEVSEEYVFKVISPPKVAEQKSKPRRSLIAILGFFVGGLLSVLMVILKYLIYDKEKETVNASKLKK